MGRRRQMSLSPAQKAWMTIRHKATVSGLKQPKSASSKVKGAVHQLNGHNHYEHQWYVPSTTDPRKVYKVSQTDEGVFMCDCPRFKFQRGPVASHTPCAHILAVKGMGVKAG